MSRRATQLLLALLGGAAGLIAAEVVLRATFPRLDFRFPTERITDDRFTNRAGKTIDGNGVRYTFDAGGFRTSGGSAPGVADRTVLFIGDSFTQGFGVGADQSFPAVTCERLAKQGIAARCLNAGVTGFGTAHELRLLRRLLANAALHVDAVVFQILPNNDLRDDFEDGGFGLEDGTLVVRDPARVPRGVWMRETLLDNSFAHGTQLVKLAANAWHEFFGDFRYDSEAFELERRLLEAVVSTARQREIPIVLLICATAWEIGSTSSQPYDEPARLDFVASTVAELQVPWIDARKVAAAEEYYIPDDGHLSPSGNAVIGAALAQQLAPLFGHSP